MSAEFLKPSNDPEHWKKGALYAVSVLEGIDMEAARKKAPTPAQESAVNAERQEALAPVSALLNAITAANWPHNRLLYTLGHFSADQLLLLCETRRVEWNYAYRAKAAFGTAEELAAFDSGMRLQGQAPDLTSALVWAGRPQLLVAGLFHEGNLATSEWLLERGANPNYDNGSIYREAVDNGRSDIGRAFARHAQAANMDLSAWMNWAKSNGRQKLYRDLRAIWWDYARYTPADSQTLIEVKPLSAADQNAGQVRYIFNFAAQRVTEIYEVGHPNQRHVDIRDFAFEDYNDDALRIARDKLRELGGSPADHVSSPGGRKGVTRAHVKGLG